MRSSWGQMFADDNADEDQDTIKVRFWEFLFENFCFGYYIGSNFFKRTLIDTNPYLLALTVVITLIHNVFEFLAFKNGIFLLCFSFYASLFKLIFLIF